MPRANSGDRGTLRFYAYTRLQERRFLTGAQSARFWPVCDRRARRPRPAQTNLYLRLLGYLQGIVNLDPEVSDGVFQFGMAA